MQVDQPNEALLKKLDLSGFIAVPKIIRPCIGCQGKLKSVVAVKHDDSNQALCATCFREAAKNDWVKHRTNDPIMIGESCDRCSREQATGVYKYSERKYKLCNTCGSALFAQINNTLPL